LLLPFSKKICSMDENFFLQIACRLNGGECMRVEKDVALGARATSFSQNSWAGKEQSRIACLDVRDTRHEEGRRFGAKAASFFELISEERSIKRKVP
jgi:hypothetical protein